MKKKLLTPLFTFTFCLHLSLFAVGLPEDWEVDLAAQPPQVFTLQRPRGETYELKAVLKRHGKPFEPAITNACIYWQTNGMENLYWSAPASVSNNVLRAYWLPEMDPGATTVRGYIGDPGHIYAAAFQFRFIASPGALPNELPLPQKVIDFAKVTVLNPPWSGGGGVNTNAVRDIAREEITTATNRLYKTLIDAKDGAARTLPAYLHALDFDDSYHEAAAEYYRQRLDFGGCSAVRSGGFLYRNFDYPFDDRAEFVVKMSAGKDRFASVGVAQVGTNLTEQIVTSGKPSRWYKALPGATVDGINENGVVAEINVVNGEPQWEGGASPALHPLAAVRWALDHATNAEHAATYLAAHISFPSGWTQNFHYMIADAEKTYIVENGTAHAVPSASSPTGALPALTNFRLYGDPKDTTGEGQERYIALTNGANITSQWWTLTYTPDGYRASDLPGITGAALTQLFNYWGNNPRESHRGETFGDKVWWQTVHTSVYDITNRVLRVAVQERPDWYVFQVPSAVGVKVETDPTVPEWAKQPTPPESMPSTGVVWNARSGKLVTKDGGKTIGAIDVGAIPTNDTVKVGNNFELTGEDFVISWEKEDEHGDVGRTTLSWDTYLGACFFSGWTANAFTADNAKWARGLINDDASITIREEVYYLIDRNHINNDEYPDGYPLAALTDIPTAYAWSAITNTPTTLAGYGITDAYKKGETDELLSTKRDMTNLAYSVRFIKPEYLPISNGTGVTRTYDWSSYSIVVSTETPGNFELLDAGGYSSAVIKPDGTVFGGDRIKFNGTALARNLPVAEIVSDSLALESKVVANDDDYASVRAKALNSAQYHEYGYPFLGRQDLMVKDAMVVGTTNYAQRAQHTEYCDGTIQNEARDCYLYLPHNKSGDIAVEDPFEIVALIDIASTNATARTSLSAKVMSVIDAAVEAKITTALAAHRIRTYDDVRHCWWVCNVVNGVPTWTVEE